MLSEWPSTRIVGRRARTILPLARYLAFDLAHDEVIAEAQHLSSSKHRRKKPRLDHQESTMLREMEGVHDKVRELERELNKMNDLIQRERLSNDELQGVRTELIKGLNDILRGNHVQIGINNVGEIDSKVFITEMEKRFSSSSYAVIKGVELCSLWREKLANPQWHPFQIVEDDKGRPQILVNDNDELLRALKQEWRNEVYNAVRKALKELNEYSPRKRSTVPEIWNFNKNRKAKMEEAISFVFAELMTQKQLKKTGKTATQLLIKS
ncbi:hypothetical protein C2S52_016140 [Perilla frutescens var. hirtella]|nr:hypothetical protein C2S52_016140 [Perilla frutescens var. hirtella]KAH6815106.1 hypothetical protein C2S51_019926 [Perilla frutescens var. frutescens]